jgi:hypothetical protein
MLHSAEAENFPPAPNSAFTTQNECAELFVILRIDLPEPSGMIPVRYEKDRP